MSIWSKLDFRQVTITVSGEMFAEHVDMLKHNLLDRLQYGYHRVLLDMNSVREFPVSLIAVLAELRQRFAKHGGELVIDYQNGMIREWDS
ncbi:hypothetical protein P22_0707 [Propionispora sp. 2/2-37]|uniref:STAS domain-containing protein n=1 Tax=Propionispora sp. 2/2-37 TaxID=1677858 RepID=UPI0006BB63AF|nr:STAS domain-containing protein [Propionispora sp. 2/2-37]CUH94641.1 hypothetical protein P22_0707 [Propionispora sp. 2/2-37]